MDNETSVFTRIVMILALGALLLWVVSMLTGCATAPCLPAEQVMADKGTVVECWRGWDPQSEDRVTKCLIIRKDGNLKTMRVTKRHCGVN